jgi:signal transduction histidine kinase
LKISYLLILPITVLFLIYAIHGYLTYEFAINEAKKITLLRSEAQANNIIQDLDKYIYSQMIDIQELTKTKQIQSSVMESNMYFENLKPERLASLIDVKNNTDSKMSFLKNVKDNKILDGLRALLTSYENGMIKEFIVTNQYGVVISLDSDESDYLQSDKEWWQITKNKQNYVGRIAYDKNYDDYVIPMAFPILDDSSNYVGTLWLTLSSKSLFHDFLNDVDILKESKKNVVLLDKNGNIIYENGIFFPSLPIKEYFSRVTKYNDSFEFGFPDTMLISYATSIGFRDFGGFGWIAVIEQDSSVIEEFEILEKNFLYSTLVGVVSATVLAIILSKFVTNPLNKLSRLTKLLGKGDFDVKVQGSKITEINSIMNAFKEMEISLKKLFAAEKNLVEANMRIKTERLTAIGELAASMAHDMKNPLGTIRTGMDILKRNTESKPEIDSVIQRMDRAVSRMSHQVEDVLNYVRKNELLIKPASLKSIITSAIQSLEIPQTIQIDVDKNDIVIDCDEKKIEVVLTNLVLNSIQAIDQNPGKINIGIKQINDNAVVEIKDSGPGIPRKIVHDIFKPLVTTKQKGTGLGLASCKNIIEQHGGSISFKNNPTIFIITLPLKQTTR